MGSLLGVELSGPATANMWVLAGFHHWVQGVEGRPAAAHVGVLAGVRCPPGNLDQAIASLTSREMHS